MKKDRFVNNTTELVFIIDRSGSMHGLENDTIGGFNSMIDRQKSNKNKCFVTTFLFNHHSTILHDRLPLSKIKPITEQDYTVSGSTALIDTVCDAVRHIKAIHKYARKKDVPAHTIFVIITDGYENCSHKYTYADLSSMINMQKNKYGWEFMFIGANIDAVDTAATMGISEERTANYKADAKGTRLLYDTLSETIDNYRCRATLDTDWCDKLNEDCKNRS